MAPGSIRLPSTKEIKMSKIDSNSTSKDDVQFNAVLGWLAAAAVSIATIAASLQ